MNFKEAMKLHNMTVADLAIHLDVSSPQIYKWMREGISSENKYFDTVISLLPELTPIEPTKTNTANIDRRTNSGVNKRTEVTLQNTKHSVNPLKEFQSDLFPKIRFKKSKTK